MFDNESMVRQERRSARAARIADAMARRALAVAQQGIVMARDALVAAARRFRDHTGRREHLEEAGVQLQVELIELGGGGPFGLLAAVLMVLMWFAIGAIDLAFLAGVSHLMIGLLYVTPGGPPWWAAVAAVAAILLVEIGLSARIALAQRAHARGEPNAGVAARRWRLLGGTLAIVVPALGTVTVLTALGAATLGFDAATHLLLTLGIVTLAVVCHTAVIFGGDSALHAFSQVLCAPRLWWLGWRAGRAQLGATGARDQARDARADHEMQLSRYRERFGDPPSHLLVQGPEAELVRRAVGIAPPAATGTDAPPDADAGPAPGRIRGAAYFRAADGGAAANAR